jgi:hypothetical protein
MMNFIKKEDGAVTVDWVVLTAAVCGIALAAILSVFSGTSDFGDSVEVYLTSRTIGGPAGLE